MYGFVEKHGANIFETVEIPTKILVETFELLSIDTKRILKKKILALFDIGLIDDNSSIGVNCEGIFNQTETLKILQVNKKKILSDNFASFLLTFF